METFGQRLLKLREAKGITQQKLAEDAGLHRVAIAKIESGARDPMWQTGIKLIKALGAKCKEFEDVVPAKKRGG